MVLNNRVEIYKILEVNRDQQGNKKVISQSLRLLLLSNN